jgi:hypothetical protein
MEHEELASLSRKAALQEVFEADIRCQDAEWRARVDRLSGSIIAWRMALLRSLGPGRAFA